MFALYLACTCLICVILQRYFGDINGLSSSTPLDPSLLRSYFMVQQQFSRDVTRSSCVKIRIAKMTRLLEIN